MRLVRLPRCVLIALTCAVCTVGQAASLRIVTYNAAADINGVTQVPPQFITVLQGVGDEATYTTARPIDILALQETTSNTTTVDPIVTSLNGVYGTGAYARSPYQGTQNGSPTFGNGPNAIIYKTASVDLIDSVGIGTPTTEGFPRQPVRYQFRPEGANPSYDFYIYVSHYKASTGSDNVLRRNIEAQAIRANAALLPGTPRIIYTGDFNMYNSNETAYQTLLAASPSPGQGFDPLISTLPADWSDNATWKSIMTYSSTDLHVRFDFQLVTNNILNDANGLKLVSNSSHTFGVNGTSYQTAVNSSLNTALPNLPNRTAVLNALYVASDHLPVVADYTVPDPSNGDFDHDGDTDLVDFAHLQECFAAMLPGGCTDADMSGDNAVDTADLNLFLNCMAGPNQPPGC